MRGDFIFLVAIITLFASCQQHSFEDKQALLDYIKNPDNGYLQKKNVNGVDFSLLYRPTDLLVSQELSTKPSQKEIDSLRNKYSDYLYFNLSLSKNGKELLSSVPKNQGEFGGMVNQLAFGMNRKIHLIANQRDTIPMLDYVYPRVYGMGKTTSVLLVYPKGQDLKQSETLKLTLEDLGVNSGEVNFRLKTDNLLKQPTIRFN